MLLELIYILFWCSYQKLLNCIRGSHYIFIGSAAIESPFGNTVLHTSMHTHSYNFRGIRDPLKSYLRLFYFFSMTILKIGFCLHYLCILNVKDGKRGIKMIPGKLGHFSENHDYILLHRKWFHHQCHQRDCMEGQLRTVCRALRSRQSDLCRQAAEASLQMWLGGGHPKVSLMKRSSKYQANNHTSFPSSTLSPPMEVRQNEKEEPSFRPLLRCLPHWAHLHIL